MVMLTFLAIFGFSFDVVPGIVTMKLWLLICFIGVNFLLIGNHLKYFWLINYNFKFFDYLTKEKESNDRQRNINPHIHSKTEGFIRDLREV